MNKKLKVESTISIKKAMQLLNETAEKCLIVVNKQDKLLGTITDGDIRRTILSGANFSIDISSSYNKKPYYVLEGDYSEQFVKNILTEKKVDLIPVVNNNNIVINCIQLSDLTSTNKLKQSTYRIPVVIMAGGKGSRLKPFTDVLPKPLVPVHEKPIIEHIIDKFTAIGCEEFYVTINYKGKILKAYFEELSKPYKISFVEESDFFGTAGSLKLIDKNINSTFFVSNCDIIIKSDYAKVFEFHKNGNYDVTLVASAKEYIIPYGTCDLDKNGNLSHINEKPSYDFLINTGLYIINPNLLDLIPRDEFYHITHLIEDAKNKGMKVGVFPIEDSSWIDVGQWNEYKDAIKKL